MIGFRTESESLDEESMDPTGISFDSHRVWRRSDGNGSASPVDEAASTDANTTPYGHIGCDPDG